MPLIVIAGIVLLFWALAVIAEKFDKAKRFDQRIAKYGELEAFQAQTQQKRIELEGEIQFLREQLSRDKEAVLAIGFSQHRRRVIFVESQTKNSPAPSGRHIPSFARRFRSYGALAVFDCLTIEMPALRALKN
jgi:hypothetical protein